MREEYGVILLAAGKSSRLGRPKQALVYEGTTLLRRMVQTAVQSGCGQVVVVLGAEAALYANDCEGALTVINENWQQGMAGSICCGLRTLTGQFPNISGAIISVCDQPFVSAALLRQLMERHRETGLPIIASDYGGITGTPVFFHCSLFPELMKLDGDKGAKQLVQKEKDRVGYISFPSGLDDIDTEEDYERLLKKNNK